MKRKMTIATLVVTAVAAIAAASASAYGSPIDGCQHSPTPQLCAGGSH